ncbi:hypothetical protein [Melioribacter sp. OK-6-Me]|uniref:hypothetical protein n=1 Tax=unclassified Melioribacter TaxID=2627329 RepID=UPI003ED87885
MPPNIRDITYYFGRLNLIAHYENKREFLLKALKSNIIWKHKDTNWGFFDIEEIDSEHGSFIHGYLVKYSPNYNEEVANPETHNLEEQQINNYVLAKSRFFLHINSGLITYHPVGVIISKEIFRKNFCKLFEHSLEGMFVSAEIQSIDEEEKIFEAIKKFKKVLKLQIYLHPSNPNNRDIWKRTDDRLKKLGASKYKEYYEAQEDGNLNITDDEEINSKISMADDGYGQAAVTGEMDGEKKTVKTGDNPVTAKAPGDNLKPAEALEILMAKIKEIFGRFKHED